MKTASALEANVSKAVVATSEAPTNPGSLAVVYADEIPSKGFAWLYISCQSHYGAGPSSFEITEDKFNQR